jgi:signal transduction histidine kinase
VTAVELPTGCVYVGALRDISERRELERMQREFIAMVGHELRTPLTALKIYIHMMQRSERYSARAIEAILVQSGRLERLINDLLDTSRLDANKLELKRTEVDLLAVARSVVEQAQALSPVHKVRLQAPPQPLVGHWDRDRIEQVLQNLLLNAIKYSPGGPVTVRVNDLGAEARVAVRDRGPGIPPEALPRLFDRFFRAQAGTSRIQGLGLGLYISKALVEAHDGQITVTSRLGRGTTFTLTLPYDQPKRGAHHA